MFVHKTSSNSYLKRIQEKSLWCLVQNNVCINHTNDLAWSSYVRCHNDHLCDKTKSQIKTIVFTKMLLSLWVAVQHALCKLTRKETSFWMFSLGGYAYVTAFIPSFEKSLWFRTSDNLSFFPLSILMSYFYSTLPYFPRSTTYLKLLALFYRFNNKTLKNCLTRQKVCSKEG